MSEDAVTPRGLALRLARTLRNDGDPPDPQLRDVLGSLTEVIRKYLADTLGMPAADPGGPDPRRVRLGEILAQRGPRGATAGELGVLLGAEGLGARRETIHRWLNSYEAQGLACRPEVAHRATSCWTWTGA